MIKDSDNRAGCAAERGSVLILALWTLFFLGALAMAVGAHVSAAIRRATALRDSTTAYYLARCGIERAIFALETGTTNDWSGTTSEYWSKDSEIAGYGRFSVVSVRSADGRSETNQGVIALSCKTNINNLSDFKALLEEKIGTGPALKINDAVMEYRQNKKTLTLQDVNGKFESIYELLLVPGMGLETFTQIEPYITVYKGNCFEGVALGKTGKKETADSRIAFVWDRNRRKILYWHEY